MNADTMTERPMVSCTRHGLLPFQGHLKCTKCARVYQTKHIDKANYVPVKHAIDPDGDGSTITTCVCACGEMLLEPMNLDTREMIPMTALPLAKKRKLTGLRICFHCFRQALKQGGGRLLSDV